MNAVMDHFYSIYHRQAGEKPGCGEKIGKDMLRRFIRQQAIKAAAIVEEVHRVGVMESLDALIEHANDCPCGECTGHSPQVEPEVPDPLAYYQSIIDHGGGIITLGDHLGVLVGPDYTNTPAGWLYVPIENTTTAEQLKHWVDAVRTGRTDWPSKEVLR
jgi:hypothetical protein